MGLEEYCPAFLKKGIAKDYKSAFGMTKREVADDPDASALSPEAMSSVPEIIDHVARANPVRRSRGANGHVAYESADLASVLGKKVRARISVANVLFGNDIASVIDQTVFRASDNHAVANNMRWQFDVGARTNMKMNSVTTDSVGVRSFFQRTLRIKSRNSLCHRCIGPAQLLV